MRRNLSINLRLALVIGLLNGCVSMSDSPKNKESSRVVEGQWYSVSTSTIFRANDQAQSFVNWYYRRLPGKVEVMACQVLASTINSPPNCDKRAFFPDIGTAEEDLYWTPHWGDGSHGGQMAFVSFYRQKRGGIWNMAHEQIFCAAPLLGDIACSPTKVLPK